MGQLIRRNVSTGCNEDPAAALHSIRTSSSMSQSVEFPTPLPPPPSTTATPTCHPQIRGTNHDAHQVLQNSGLPGIRQVHRIDEGAEGARRALARCYVYRAGARDRARDGRGSSIGDVGVEIVSFSFPALRASRGAAERAGNGTLCLAVVAPKLSDLGKTTMLE